MEHLPWYPLSEVGRVRVPFICGDDHICNGDHFLDFAQQLGWESDQFESFAQLARRAQAWLFFGLLGIVGITPDQCISKTSPRGARVLAGTGEVSTTTVAGPSAGPDEQPLVDTSALPTLLSNLRDRNHDELLALKFRLTEATAKANHILTGEWIPLIRHYAKTQDTLTLWNSKPYAILFSIDVLLDTLQDTVADISPLELRPELRKVRRKSLLPDLTSVVANSLRYVGKCGSLAHRLDLKSSEFYHLLSLPNGLNVNHSRCAKAHCSCFDINEQTYRTKHVDDCIMCENHTVLEADLVRIIRQDEVPLIRSTTDKYGNVTIAIVKMTIDTDYIAISHVWACGLGNFQNNGLPQCQLQVIDSIRAINSMGRIYAGAAKVLVLDPALHRISLSSLQRREMEIDKAHHKELSVTRANMLVDASPWMARSWPLQEAALAPRIYVQFADKMFNYSHKRLGIATNLSSIPDQDLNESRLVWADPFDDSNEFLTGEALPYSPNTEFIKVWNQLTKRTTSYSEDVPAIFAALLYKSAGELLSVAPCYRTQAILRSLDFLPLDILTSERESLGREDSANGSNTDWVPRLPGSRIPVPTLDPAYGILQRVANGFLIQRQEIQEISHSTRALVCPSGLPSSGRFALADPNFKETFRVQINAFTPNSKDKSRGYETLEGPHLLLLISKPSIEDCLWNSGVLFAICEHTEDVLRVQLVKSTVTWCLQHNNEHSSEPYIVKDRIKAANPFSILIEMMYPFQYWQAQVGEFGSLSFLEPVVLVTLSLVLVSIGAILLVLITIGDRPVAAYFIALGVAIIVCIHATIAWARTINLRAAIRRRSRYFWALSFWDDGQARKILSSVPNPIPSGAVFVDLALMASLITPLSVLSGRVIDLSNANASLLIVGVCLIMFATVSPYLFRFPLLIYMRLQWYFSTFEYRTNGQTSPRVNVALRFISTWLQANFLTQLISLMAILVSVTMCTMFFFLLKATLLEDEKGGESLWRLLPPRIMVAVILVVILGVSIRLLASGTGMLVRDTRRRIQWMYEHNSAVSQENHETSDRNIQLV
ncbi:uncharacterized protein K444DRAFT_661042 [Hyaloscypha bicolor E]|uniref:Heterokaryon incompatibility domain-containing protein n=1 Tax=Hyaloscypha bicolor E TaxID=1095630 RepID=A0A2J6TKU1_9HELO|nr:uncharacterized protein K444DRAFT_661042 [Hyaloscypha bicolor E]PMD63598.1 hypothetical protein K444DRAFT_661042 [Hyaloscypha bicolor E]